MCSPIMVWQKNCFFFGITISITVPMSHIPCSVPLKSHRLSACSLLLLQVRVTELLLLLLALPSPGRMPKPVGRAGTLQLLLLWASRNTKAGICPAPWKELAFNPHGILPKYSLCITVFKSTEEVIPCLYKEL